MKTPSLSSGEAGKLPRRFLQHMANDPVAAQTVWMQWVDIGGSLLVVTGHCRLLGNQFSTNLAQSQWLVVGCVVYGSRAHCMAKGVL